MRKKRTKEFLALLCSYFCSAITKRNYSATLNFGVLPMVEIDHVKR